MVTRLCMHKMVHRGFFLAWDTVFELWDDDCFADVRRSAWYESGIGREAGSVRLGRRGERMDHVGSREGFVF